MVVVRPETTILFSAQRKCSAALANVDNNRYTRMFFGHAFGARQGFLYQPPLVGERVWNCGIEARQHNDSYVA